MARRVAIVLRGAPGAGKSPVTDALRERYPLSKSSRVSLDTCWGPGEKRFAGHCRYWDLCDQPDVLIIELGHGEPTDRSFLGATKNPREWVSILENDGREIFFFLLQVSQCEGQRRKKAKGDHVYSPEVYKRFEAEGECSHTVFSALLGNGHLEEPIDTEKTDVAGMVDRIVTKVGSV
jgi:hypothetical protein